MTGPASPCDEPTGPVIRAAGDEHELQAALELRRAVFVGEQGVPEELELDGRDDGATHLVAVRDGVVVGTVRLLTDGAVMRLGRLAVARAARRQGLARALLDASERLARERGLQRIVLSAQTYAMELYTAAGYEPRGGIYLEAGIEHVAMELAVA